MKYNYCIMLMLLMTFCTQAKPASDEQTIRQLLDDFHQAAANVQTQHYFSLMSDDFVFLGTDASERWPKTDFKQYVRPFFNKGRGWLFIPKQRNISFVNNAQVAFFDELLNSASYGLCRGTGILVKSEQGWKLSQYSLSVPLPNGIAKNVVQQIKQFQESE